MNGVPQPNIAALRGVPGQAPALPPGAPGAVGRREEARGRRRIPRNQELLPFCWAWLAHRGQLVQGPTTAVCHSCLARATGHLRASLNPSGWSSLRRTVWNQEPKHSVCRWRVQHCVKKTGVQQDRAGARAAGRPVNQPRPTRPLLPEHCPRTGDLVEGTRGPSRSGGSGALTSRVIREVSPRDGQNTHGALGQAAL